MWLVVTKLKSTSYNISIITESSIVLYWSRPSLWTLDFYIQLPSWYLHLDINKHLKTKILIFILKHVPSTFSVNVNSTLPAVLAKNHGVTLDLALISLHIQRISKFCQLYIQNLTTFYNLHSTTLFEATTTFCQL